MRPYEMSIWAGYSISRRTLDMMLRFTFVWIYPSGFVFLFLSFYVLGRELGEATTNRPFGLGGQLDRKGTFVHPDYQRQGIGSMICELMDGIADKAGST